jgi:alpha-galactosidase
VDEELSQMRGRTVRWGNDRLELELSTDPGAPVSVVAMTLVGRPAKPASATPGDVGADRPEHGGYTPSAHQALVEVLAVGHGRARASLRTVETAVGTRLRHTSHRTWTKGEWEHLAVVQTDPVTGLEAEVVLSAAAGVAGVRVVTTIRNRGTAPVQLQAVTTLAASLYDGPATVSADRLELFRGQAQWLGEGCWTAAPLRAQGMVDLGLELHGQDQRGLVAATGLSTWSTGGELPVGILVDTETGTAWGWQVENNGTWSWELGERIDGVCLALLGPSDDRHQWGLELAPGAEFATVPAALVVSGGGFEGAVAELTGHRRALRAEHGVSTELPVIYNDYMNTLMGDPTTERLLPLVAAAAEVGADIFCIDAGWYDDGADWWDSVGEWQPSHVRFPNGIDEVLGAIRAAGMVAGLWLEPEVVGVRSPFADALPAEAFFQRGGQRVIEHGRLHLDLRHPAARAHLDEVVDRLVALGVGYFKLDYNITAGPGTDVGTPHPGHGLLEYSRAYLGWLDGVLSRHPGLLLENCSSGAMRQDYALLARLHLQSTSDQQDAMRYPPIASTALVSVLPEQAGNWAYPQPEMTDEEIRFTLATGMIGRLYLSGHLDRMSPAQRELVADAVAAHRGLLGDVAAGTPFWPAGLPTWTQPWVTLGLHGTGRDLITCWRRPGASPELTLQLPDRRGTEPRIEWVGAGADDGWSAEWDAATGELTLRTDHPAPTARTIAVHDAG